MKQVMIRLFDDSCYLAETDFTQEEIEETVIVFREKYGDYQDNDERLIKDLQSSGYIKIISKPMELIEIW